ncbi:hypothetical protein ACHAWO_013587 [Cyclotella atomus]|uniref:Secreted protein n=1 Tax=Cyclotella atomus TaxID=382360 RepID=A0ABD3PG15_9STRA
MMKLQFSVMALPFSWSCCIWPSMLLQASTKPDVKRANSSPLGFCKSSGIKCLKPSSTQLYSSSIKCCENEYRFSSTQCNENKHYNQTYVLPKHAVEATK